MDVRVVTTVTSQDGGAWVENHDGIVPTALESPTPKLNPITFLSRLAHGSPLGKSKPAHRESFPGETLDPGVLGIGWLSTELIEHNMTGCSRGVSGTSRVLPVWDGLQSHESCEHLANQEPAVD